MCRWQTPAEQDGTFSLIFERWLPFSNEKLLQQATKIGCHEVLFASKLLAAASFPVGFSHIPRSSVSVANLASWICRNFRALQAFRSNVKK